MTFEHTNPQALHLPALGHTTDDGITRCGQRVSRIARVTKYASIVTCATCIARMTDGEKAMRRDTPRDC